jgi:putative ABC transport system ATP-binding protein
VLRALSLEVRGGAVTAVSGRSGSGKSTLLHLLAGLDVADAGTVEVLGHDVGALDETGRALLRRQHVGVVTQGGDLVPFLTAQETVELALELRGLPPRGARERLAAVGLAELAGQRVARLSLGERQRVAVARALAARPALLVADEPTARLDEENARAVGTLLAELARETGTAVVCATHDPALLEHADLEVPLDRLGV